MDEMRHVIDEFFDKLERLESRMVAVEAASLGEPWRVALKPLEHRMEKCWQAIQESQQAPPCSVPVQPPEERQSEEGGLQRPAVGGEARIARKSSTVESVLAEDEARAHSHAISDSIFEASFLIGLRSVGSLHSLLIAFALALDLAVSFTTMYLVQTSFIGRQFPTIDEIRIWRGREGHLHDNIGPSGASLVSRLCRADPGLITALDKKDMLENLDLYLGANVGLVLAAMMLLVWFIVVSREILQALSFIVAVCDRPTGATAIVCDEDSCLCVHFVSHSRKVAMAILFVARLGKAGWLLYAGSAWLANETHISDLILNAAALTFVLDLDSMFNALLTSHTKTIVADLQPLPQKHNLFHGFLAPSLTILLGICFVGYTVRGTVMPMQEDMIQVKDALCAGQQDFVFTKDFLGVLWSAPTEPFSSELASIDSAAVMEAVDAGGIWLGSQMGLVRQVAALMYYADEGVGQLVTMMSGLEGPLAKNLCDDFPFLASNASGGLGINMLLTYTMRRLLMNPDIVDCAGVQPYCDSPVSLARTLCPATCGCDDPLSGLFLADLEAGCPRPYCVETRAAVLEDLPCEDTPAEELQSSAAWLRYWSAWKEALGTYVSAGSNGNGELEPWPADPMEGCDVVSGLFGLASSLGFQVCEGDTRVGGIAALCPVECFCFWYNWTDCPPSCQ